MKHISGKKAQVNMVLIQVSAKPGNYDLGNWIKYSQSPKPYKIQIMVPLNKSQYTAVSNKTDGSQSVSSNKNT